MEEIQLRIKLMDNNYETFTLKIKNCFRVLQLKEECEKITKIPLSSQNLVYNGRILGNDRLLTDYDIKNNSLLHLVKKHEVQSIKEENSFKNENIPNNILTNNSRTNSNLSSNYSNKKEDSSESTISTKIGKFNKKDYNDYLKYINEIKNSGLNPNPQTIEKCLKNPIIKKLIEKISQNDSSFLEISKNLDLNELGEYKTLIQEFQKNPDIFKSLFSSEMYQNCLTALEAINQNKNENQNNLNNLLNFSPIQNPPGIELNQNMDYMNLIYGNKERLNYTLQENIKINEIDNKDKYREQLNILSKMGFNDEKKNIEKLELYNGNIDFTIQCLLENN